MPVAKYTAEDGERLRALIDEGMAPCAAADHLGIPRGSVTSVMERFGIPKVGGPGRPVEIGERFGRLLVVEEVEERLGRHRTFRCACDCGNEKIASSGNLRAGNIVSCGCRRKEIKHDIRRLQAQKAKKDSDRSLAAVRDAARQRRQFKIKDLIEASGRDRNTVAKHLGRLADLGAVSRSVHAWNIEKPQAKADLVEVRRASRRRDYSGAGPSGRAQLPPTKELREVALEYGGKCRALPNGHYELTLANGSRVTLAGTPTNAGGAAKAARAEIEKKLAA